MNTSELKLDLIQAISLTDNVELLQKLHDLLLVGKTEPKIYHFNEEQLSEINEALEQYKNGNYMTEEEAEKDIQDFLKVAEKEGVYILSAEEQKSVNIAMEQYRNGKYISNEEAQKDIQKWFDEQEK